MPLIINDLVNEILPYVKKVLINGKDEIQKEINRWLKDKGYIVYLIGTKFIPIAWDLITGPLLPFILTTAINVAFGRLAPFAVVLLPLIDRLVDYINDKYLSDMEKQKLLDIIKLIISSQTLQSMSPQEKQQILYEQEYFISV